MLEHLQLFPNPLTDLGAIAALVGLRARDRIREALALSAVEQRDRPDDGSALPPDVDAEHDPIPR